LSRLNKNKKRVNKLYWFSLRVWRTINWKSSRCCSLQ